MNKVAVVTGGSSGIGLCTARELAARGYKVFEFSRRKKSVQGIIHIPCDVTDEAQVIRAMATVNELAGRLDLLVNNAGFGVSGAVEFTALESAKSQLEVNLFGGFTVAKAALPYLRESRGRIINLSSVAAAVPIPFQAWYSVSKAAVNALTMALANEVRPFGVSVCAIMPGDISSGFTDARKKSADGDDLYEGRISRSVAVMERDEKTGMAPEKAAKFIANVARKTKVKPIYTIGFKYQFFVLLSKLLPVGVVNNILYSMYAK